METGMKIELKNEEDILQARLVEYRRLAFFWKMKFLDTRAELTKLIGEKYDKGC